VAVAGKDTRGEERGRDYPKRNLPHILDRAEISITIAAGWGDLSTKYAFSQNLALSDEGSPPNPTRQRLSGARRGPALVAVARLAPKECPSRRP